ncbi:MAG: radical SAM protein [Candidatus Pacearchaeota archaeon]|jgi:MoaA/NifB/PqqE/SkfB family radical SAM enzyme
MDITWLINHNCNYNCPYCINNSKEIKKIVSNKKELSKKKIKDPEVFYEFFDSLKLPCKINIGGGEPFLEERFIETCKNITKKHEISIITNLSSDKIYEFAKKINPKKVMFINASFHWTEINNEAKLKDFIKKYRYLKSKGFRISSTIVMWPPVFPKFNYIYNRLKKEGIYLRPVSFYGNFKNKNYPDSYNKNQLKFMKKFSDYSIKNLDKKNIEEYKMDIIKNSLSFKGILCSSGKDHIIIDSNGNIRKCLSSFDIIGNILEKKWTPNKNYAICKENICRSHREGLKFSFNNFKNKNIKKSHNIRKKINNFLNYLIE